MRSCKRRGERQDTRSPARTARKQPRLVGSDLVKEVDIDGHILNHTRLRVHSKTVLLEEVAELVSVGQAEVRFPVDLSHACPLHK